MKNKPMLLVWLSIFWVLFPVFLRPCTTFCLKNGNYWVFGRNYDWDIEYCLITVNKHGVAKTAFLQGREGIPASWTSKYGSVTFNQYGREFPLGGMNEAGLVIEVLWLEQTVYPAVDRRAVLPELQWVQYQLDTAASIQDVVSSNRNIRIEREGAQPLHFLVCDNGGQVAVIEFLEGRMRSISAKELPVAALANGSYKEEFRLFNLCRGIEDRGVFKNANNSQQRFIRAAKGVQDWQKKPSGSPVDYAFSILENVRQEMTMFRIVYDVKAGLIYFRTKSAPKVRYIRFDSFDFSCNTPVQILDIALDLQGDVTRYFRDYSREINYRLIQKSFSGTFFLKNIGDDKLRKISLYPETLHCI